MTELHNGVTIPQESTVAVWLLRMLFVAILLSMVGAISWASLQCPLFAIPPEVLRHPWFIATLVDAYWAFITFFVWVAWKEQRTLARILWFIAIVLLGNVAMALYFLRELFAVKTAEELPRVFGQRNPGRLGMPAALSAVAVGVYLIA